MEDRERRMSAPRENWRAVAEALNARMAFRRVGQKQLSDQAGVSVATLRFLQRGTGARQVQDATLAAVSRVLDWPAEHLLCVLLGCLPPVPSVEPVAAVIGTQGDPHDEILAVIRRIEAKVDGIARHVTPS